MNNLRLKTSVICLLALTTTFSVSQLYAQTNPILTNPAKTKSTSSASTSIDSKSTATPSSNQGAASGSLGSTNPSVSGNSITTTTTQVNSNVPYDTMINGVKYRKKTFNQHYPAQYKYEYIDQYRYTNYALGLDYTNESYLENDWNNNVLNDLKWDSLGQLQNSSGFNIYFIGKLHPERLIPAGRFNWGIDMGFSHFRRGSKNNVELSTINKDSGFTRLETMAFNMSGMLRYEYALGRFYPFIGIHGGFSVYSTDQYTQSYIQLVDYETSGTTSVRNSATVYWSPEVGVRVRLTPGVSMVAAYERRFGNNINITDISKSKFNGLAYSENSKSINYNTETFKIGFLFDLGGRERERKEIVPARDTTIAYLEAVNETTTTTTNTQQNSYQQNTVNNPCPCPCLPTTITPNAPTGNSGVNLNGSSSTNSNSSINTGTSGIGSSKSKVDSPVTGSEIPTSTSTNKTNSGANILIYGGGNGSTGNTSSGRSGTGSGINVGGKNSSTGGNIVLPGGTIGNGTGSGIGVGSGVKLPTGTSAKPPVKSFPGISTPPVTIKKPKS